MLSARFSFRKCETRMLQLAGRRDDDDDWESPEGFCLSQIAAFFTSGSNLGWKKYRRVLKWEALFGTTCRV